MEREDVYGKAKKEIFKLLKEREGVSLNELLRGIRKSTDLRVGHATIKKIVISDSNIKVRAILKKSMKRIEDLNQCVVCHNRDFTSVYRTDLLGNKILYEKICKRCKTKYTDNKTSVRKYMIYLLKH